MTTPAQYAFYPSDTLNAVTCAATSAVQVVSINTKAIWGSIRICVAGTQEIAWAFGSASPTISGGVHMLPNTVEVFALPPNTSQISIIASSTGSTVYLNTGNGL